MRVRRATRNDESARPAALDPRSRSSGTTSAAQTADAAAVEAPEARRGCRVAVAANGCAAPPDRRGLIATWTDFAVGQLARRRDSLAFREARSVSGPSPRALGVPETSEALEERPSRSRTPRVHRTRTAAPTATRSRDPPPRTRFEGRCRHSRFHPSGRARRTSTRKRARKGFYAVRCRTRTSEVFPAYQRRGFRGTWRSNWRCPVPVKIPSVSTDRERKRECKFLGSSEPHLPFDRFTWLTSIRLSLSFSLSLSILSSYSRHCSRSRAFRVARSSREQPNGPPPLLDHSLRARCSSANDLPKFVETPLRLSAFSYFLLLSIAAISSPPFLQKLLTKRVDENVYESRSKNTSVRINCNESKIR